MTIAIIAAIITAIILLGTISVLILLRSRSSSVYKGSKHDIGQLDNIGIGSAVNSDATSDDEVIVNAADAKPSASAGITRRFFALGGFAGAVFAVLGIKAWTMQVMSSEDYSSKAEENASTNVSTPAPRGCIYDAKGRVLVSNKTSQTVLTDPDTAKNVDVMQRLSTVLGLPIGVVRQRANDAAGGAQSQRVIATDVNLRDVAFISEHADAFPGVSIETRTVREYPYGALAAHVIGYTGTPTEDELAQAGWGREILPQDIVGKSGVELSYDAILSGDHGQRKVMVDAGGNVISVLSETDPLKGSDLHLTIDAYAQYVADTELANLIAPLGDIGTGKGAAGAIVAMDVTDGSVLVMASYPTFDPSYFTNGIPQDIWDLYNTDESGSPLMNRTVNGQYAAASTFKAFTSMAGLHYGFADYDSLWTCGGKWDGFGSGDIQKCWNRSGHGTLDLHGGIVNSCDVVFYEIAKEFFMHGPEGSKEISETALQDYLAQYKFGMPTGIDLPDESHGRIPTPQWKAEQWKNVPSEASWRGGDYTNMIIGQGDVLITPLQLAVAYGAIANGKLLRPHLIKEVHNSSDETVIEAEVEEIGSPDVNQEHLKYVRDSLHDMVLQNKVVGPAFASMGIDAAGKSGTAEHTDREDDAWFVAYAPYDDPKYVVVCVIEQGGGGADVAGPLVTSVMGALFESEKSDEVESKVARIQGSSGHAIEIQKTSGSSRTD